MELAKLKHSNPSGITERGLINLKSLQIKYLKAFFVGIVSIQFSSIISKNGKR